MALILIPGLDHEKCSICGWCPTAHWLQTLRDQIAALHELQKREPKPGRQGKITALAKELATDSRIHKEHLKHAILTEASDAVCPVDTPGIEGDGARDRGPAVPSPRRTDKGAPVRPRSAKRAKKPA